MSRPAAAILLTGSELLRGVISDRNAAFLAASLEELGFSVRRTVVVGDATDDICAGLRLVLDGVDLVVTSGGLGPTHDDRTVEAIAAVAGVPLVLDREILEQITAWTDGVAARGGYPRDRFVAGNRKQAHIPAGASVLGLAGTAPGLVVPIGDARVVVLPGVPSELRRLWRDAPRHPALAQTMTRARPRRRHLLRLYGIGESHVADLFAEAGGDPPGVETSICARNFEIEVDIRAEPGAEEAGAGLAARMRDLLGEHVFTADERTIAALVLEGLRGRGWMAATAESCTGGLVAERLTDVPGSSDAFAGGVVAYTDALKRDLLDVDVALLAEHGAVSAPVAAAMAQGARRRLGADAAVAVTGIAGPGGATPGKPVGLVFLHASSPAGETAQELHARGSRADVRERSATAALHLLRGHLVTDP